ncbi:MAG: DUF2461 family protein [Methanothrix sp.]|nr:DUF2461 family protein [Methanothrix sp.]
MLLAGGAHMPTSADLQAIRAAIDEDPTQIKRVIEAPEFRKYFGEISGERLKSAPQGYALDHPQIDLLRLSNSQLCISSAMRECWRRILSTTLCRSSQP